jgi:hypothetical protein
MKLGHLGRWRLLGLLGAVVIVAVAIPAASGAFARTGSQVRVSHAAIAAAAATHSNLRIAEGAPKGAPGGPGGNNYTCTDGSIPTGTYNSLTIAGQCAVDQGIVKVKHNVTVQPNAGLFAAFGGGPEIAIGGNLNVKSNAILFLGCDALDSPCFNDSDGSQGFSSKGTVFGDLHSDGAFAVVVHFSSIGGDLKIHGGGGGDNCDTAGFFTVESSSVGGNATVEDLQTCWGGFFRTSVGGNFKYHNNVTADPDGNEIQTNVVQGNMNCSGNNPVDQPGDSGGFMNVAFGHATGDCADLTGP